jgi:hypothetical protein
MHKEVEKTRLQTGYTMVTHGNKQDNNECPFCNVRLTVEHIFWNCKETEAKTQRANIQNNIWDKTENTTYRICASKKLVKKHKRTKQKRNLKKKKNLKKIIIIIKINIIGWKWKRKENNHSIFGKTIKAVGYRI